MKRSWLISFILCAVLLLAACDSADDPTQPPATPSPEASAEVAAPTDASTPTAAATRPPRPTLPPSWTPTAATAPTETPRPTEGESTSAQGGAPNPACTTFGPDMENSVREFLVGESPTIAWTPVEGARLYRLFVFDANLIRVHEQLIEATTYNIPLEVFQSAGRFGWEIEPLDELGIQMCIGRGEELVAR